jgi:transposase
VEANPVLVKKKRDATDFEQAAIVLNALLDQAENGEITMAYLDEAGHSTIQPNRTCWTKEGDIHAIDASRGPRLNVMGALLSDGSLFTTDKWGTTKANDFLVFLEKLVERVKPTLEKPLYAIVDNASIHKAKTIQEGIAALGEKGLTLYFLPPYSPELNRIEILWRHIKYVWMKFQSWTKSTLAAEVHRILAGFGLEFKLAFRAARAEKQ